MTGLPINGDWKKTMLRWGTGSTVFAVVFKLLDIFQQQPKMLDAIVSWGPLFVVVVVAMVGADRRLGQFVNATEKNAVATSELASAVGVLSRKDDQRDRETEIVLNHLANGMEQVLSTQREIFVRMAGIEKHCTTLSCEEPKR